MPPSQVCENGGIKYRERKRKGAENMERGKERHMFPGSNTSEGFFSYFQYIMPQREAEHIFCLKGGPGVGKSTFMTNIGKRVQDKGVDVEYLHCSSDPESLDGLAIPALKVALIDGTAPHVCDPQYPGATGETVNLGEYLDISGIKRHKQQIIDINTETGRLFKRAYKYLKAAKCMMDDCLNLCGGEETYAGALGQAGLIIDKEFKGVIGTGPGAARSMFARAITPSGIVHYLDTLIDSSYKLYLIIGSWGAGVSDMLKRIAMEAQSRGLDTQAFYCPMDPANRMEHLIIPPLRLAFISENRYVDIEAKPDAIVDITQYVDEASVDREDLRLSENEFDSLLREAVFTLRRAKETHDELEKLYVPNMDFKGVEEKRERIEARILEYVK
jgi:hypothetical protein